MRKNLPLAFALLCATAFAAMAITFSNLSANVTNNGLVVTFTANGVPVNQQSKFSATADATATYGCFNRGGHNPHAANKQTTVNAHMRGMVTGLGTPSGTVRGTGNIPLPPAGNFTCPKGQEKALVSVSYTNVVVTAIPSGVTANVPGTFTKTFRNIE